jgi:hypothetical protein
MSNSSKYGYTTLNYKPCCPVFIPTIKTIIKSSPESQRILNLTSCCVDYVKPINEGIKHASYDRVLRRRRGKAFNPV